MYYYFTYKTDTKEYVFTGYTPDDFEDQQKYSDSEEREYATIYSVCASVITNGKVEVFLPKAKRTGQYCVILDDELKAIWSLITKSKIYGTVWLPSIWQDKMNVSVLTKMKQSLSDVNYLIWVYTSLCIYNRSTDPTFDTKYAEEYLKDILLDINIYDCKLDVTAAESRLIEVLFIS